MTMRSLLGASLALTLTLAACGGPQSGAEIKIPDGFDACSILTPQRARAAAGKPIAEITSTLEDAQGRGPLYCPYNAGTTEQLQLIGLELRPANSPRVAASHMEAAKTYLERLSKRKIQPIQGLGDEAYWVPGLQQLRTRRGPIEILATMQAGENPLDDARQLTLDTLAVLEKASAEKGQGKPAA